MSEFQTNSQRRKFLQQAGVGSPQGPPRDKDTNRALKRYSYNLRNVSDQDAGYTAPVSVNTDNTLNEEPTAMDVQDDSRQLQTPASPADSEFDEKTSAAKAKVAPKIAKWQQSTLPRQDTKDSLSRFNTEDKRTDGGDDDDEEDDEDEKDDSSIAGVTDTESTLEEDPYEAIKKLQIDHLSPSQRWCHDFFELATSLPGKMFQALSMACVIGSVMTICVESLPQYQLNADYYNAKYWLPIDATFIVIFTIEYLGRFYGAPKKWRFIVQPMNIVDLLSIIPFYISLGIPSSNASVAFRVLRTLRLLRIIKIFQFSKYSVGLNVTLNVFRRSLNQIAMASLYVVVVMLLSGALIYYAERGDFDASSGVWNRTMPDGTIQESPFQSIFQSFYWSIVTVTTLGYGDNVPITAFGKVVACITALFGVLTIALPSSILGSNFITEWQLYRRIRFQLRMQKARKNAAGTISLGSDLAPAKLTKAKQIKILKNQNQLMLEAVAECQDKLADINPPKYFSRYKKLEIRFKQLEKKVEYLEAENHHLRRQAETASILDKVTNGHAPHPNLHLPGFMKHRTRHNSAATTGHMDDDNMSVFSDGDSVTSPGHGQSNFSRIGHKVLDGLKRPNLPHTKSSDSAGSNESLPRVKTEDETLPMHRSFSVATTGHSIGLSNKMNRAMTKLRAFTTGHSSTEDLESGPSHPVKKAMISAPTVARNIGPSAMDDENKSAEDSPEAVRVVVHNLENESLDTPMPSKQPSPVIQPSQLQPQPQPQSPDVTLTETEETAVPLSATTPPSPRFLQSILQHPRSPGASSQISPGASPMSPGTSSHLPNLGLPRSQTSPTLGRTNSSPNVMEQSAEHPHHHVNIITRGTEFLNQATRLTIAEPYHVLERRGDYLVHGAGAGAGGHHRSLSHQERLEAQEQRELRHDAEIQEADGDTGNGETGDGWYG